MLVNNLLFNLFNLVNNAARVYGRASFASVSTGTILEAVNNNALGALRMIQRALPAMNRNCYGRIVNVSTGMAALTDMGGGATFYDALVEVAPAASAGA